jgi:hypothetical protein
VDAGPFGPLHLAIDRPGFEENLIRGYAEAGEERGQFVARQEALMGDRFDGNDVAGLDA